eukprot:3058530-Rhodomonas_salina.1
MAWQVSCGAEQRLVCVTCELFLRWRRCDAKRVVWAVAMRRTCCTASACNIGLCVRLQCDARH